MQPNCDNAPTSTTMEYDKIAHSKLIELKVQDLKLECRKRQLAVSGSKIQILERLKPYEDTILADFEARISIQSSGSCTKSSDINKNKQASSLDLSVIDAVASNTIQPNSLNNSNTTPNSNSSNVNRLKEYRGTVRDVINDFLQQQQQQSNPSKVANSTNKMKNCCYNANKCEKHQHHQQQIFSNQTVCKVCKHF